MEKKLVRQCVTALVMAAEVLFFEGNVVHGQAPWQPFRWFSIDAGRDRLERGAILVPVRLRGIPGEQYFQLDLGASHSSRHGGAVQDIVQSFVLSRSGMTVSGTIAGSVVEQEPVEVRERTVCGPVRRDR